MKIRNDLARDVVTDYITETFSKFEFSPTNVMNALVAKMYIYNNFNTVTQVISKDGYIDISALENFAINDLERLGRFEIPAIGTRYAFTADDAKQLINKMKEKADA